MTPFCVAWRVWASDKQTDTLLVMPHYGCCMMQVFETMTARGFPPTATTYTALISAHAKAERLDLALATFHRMVCPWLSLDNTCPRHYDVRLDEAGTTHVPTFFEMCHWKMVGRTAWGPYKHRRRRRVQFCLWLD